MKLKKRSGAWLAAGYTLVLLGGLLFADGIAAYFLANSGWSQPLTLLFGAAVAFCGMLCIYERFCPKAIAFVVAAAVVFASAVLPFLAAYGISDTASGDEDVVIVLGAGIIGRQLGRNIKVRLDKALEYHRMNPDALIVVTGGQGRYEDITEAQAMYEYLAENGVPEQSIIREERATNTFENFTFSKELIEERFGTGYSAVFITNDYHAFRASLIAKYCGFSDIGHFCGRTPVLLLVPCTLREMLGIAKHFLLEK